MTKAVQIPEQFFEAVRNTRGFALFGRPCSSPQRQSPPALPRACPAKQAPTRAAKIRGSLAGPIPNLLRMLMKLDDRGSRRRRIRRCLPCWTRNRRCGCRRFLVDGAAGFDLAAQYGAIFDGQALGLHFAGDVPRAPQLHAIATRNLAFDAAADDHFARGHIGLHRAVGADGQAAVGQLELAFDRAVNEKIFAAGDLALNANALADASRGTPGSAVELRRDPGPEKTAGSCPCCRNVWNSLRRRVFFLPHGTPQRTILASEVAFRGLIRAPRLRKSEDSTGTYRV